MYDVHQIQFDEFAQTVTFHGEYKPSAGPLPTLTYNLIGLWVYQGVVIKALFTADSIPTHDGECIFYRYESPHANHQSQAKYKYVTMPGCAGMIMTYNAFKRQGLATAKVFDSYEEEVNQSEFETWKSTQTPETLQEISMLKIEDLLGRNAPLWLALNNPAERSVPVV